MDPRSEVLLRQTELFQGSVLLAGLPADDLLRRGPGEQSQVAEAAAQRVQVQVAEVQGRVVEENCTSGVRHQLYLLCQEPKA